MFMSKPKTLRDGREGGKEKREEIDEERVNAIPCSRTPSF